MKKVKSTARIRKKKILLMILGIVILISAIGVWRAFGLGFKKVQCKELEIPKWKAEQIITNPKYEKFVDVYDIVRNTDDLAGAAGKFYSKYLDYKTPNGKPIRLLAMDQITDEQLLYAYSLLSFYLKDHGALDKRAIANKMAENEAVLIMPNGADRDGKTPAAAMTLGQNLNQQEIANVGSKWYIDCDYGHRDAAFEEIFHMVHDYGIGTTQNPGADPVTAKKIAAALGNALPVNEKDWGKSGLWGLGMESWLKELSKEGSLEQEYIVSVIDSYYGLWEPYTESEGGMWGGYCAKTREDVAEKDPMGQSTLETFLPAYIDQMMRVDPSFEGDFIMTRDKTLAYTAKSQYLKDITLTGLKSSNISANSLDNVLMGNGGNNRIDGKEGYDIVQFRGNSYEYEIEKKDGVILVRDTIQGRDGVNTLINIEILRFTDIDLEE